MTSPDKMGDKFQLVMSYSLSHVKDRIYVRFAMIIIPQDLSLSLAGNPFFPSMDIQVISDAPDRFLLARKPVFKALLTLGKCEVARRDKLGHAYGAGIRSLDLQGIELLIPDDR